MVLSSLPIHLSAPTLFWYHWVYLPNSPLLPVGPVTPHQPSHPAALGSQTFSLIKSDSSRHLGMLLLPMTHAGSRAAWLPQATRNVARTGKQGSIAREWDGSAPEDGAQTGGRAPTAGFLLPSNCFSSGASAFLTETWKPSSLLQAGLQRTSTLWITSPWEWGPKAEEARGPRPGSLDCSRARVLSVTVRVVQREEERQKQR